MTGVARKVQESVKEKFATLKVGREKLTVKAWQYYSIFNFCRLAGAERTEAEEIARWCRADASDGDRKEAGDLIISIAEREVS